MYNGGSIFLMDLWEEEEDKIRWRHTNDGTAAGTRKRGEESRLCLLMLLLLA